MENSVALRILVHLHTWRRYQVHRQKLERIFSSTLLRAGFYVYFLTKFTLQCFYFTISMYLFI